MTDTELLREAIAAHKAGQTKFTRRMAIAIGDLLGMSPMQVVSDGEANGFLKPGAVAWFRANGGITRDHVRQARHERGAAAAMKKVAGQ
jgi:hypothetical protein